tara:strand:+ start:7123 stop:7971 length:849 start_codon:yes stop_codon:yes gene_type:complete
MSTAKRNLKKIAKQIRRHGRYGDTELVHMSPKEIQYLKKISGKAPTVNPVTGLKEYWGWVVPAAVSVATGLIGASSAKKQQAANLKTIRKQEELQRMQMQNELEALETAKEISPSEARAMENLREGASKGTMDVEGLTQQMGQPIYQQGQLQQSEAMGQITTQGLEGSIIAQEVSQKIGGDVRASIADQARSIAMANQQTREASQRQLNERLFARGDMLRQIAMNKKRVEQGLEALPLQSEIAGIQAQSQYDQSMAGIYGNVISGLGKAALSGDVEPQEEVK